MARPANTRQVDVNVAAPIDTGEPILRDYATEADVLLILFSGLKRNPQKRPGFSFRAVTGGLPARKLYVRDLRKSWFLAGLPGISEGVEDTAEFLRREAGKARRVVLTGYSLGGFAAHLYASLLENAEAITFSPQTFVSFWDRLRTRDHRWQRYALKLLWRSKARYRNLRPLLEKRRQAKHTIHYAADSPLDGVHARHVASLENVRVIEHAEGRHRLVTALRDSGELRTLMERAVCGCSD